MCNILICHSTFPDSESVASVACRAIVNCKYKITRRHSRLLISPPTLRRTSISLPPSLQLISTGDVSVSAGQWEMFNMAMKGWLFHQSRSPHCSLFCLLQALCWSAWWRAWRGPRCPPVTRYGHSHTPSHSHSLLGGCHVDKLHRHGPRDHGTGLRGVSHSVSGKRRRPKHRKSETPAILWLTRFDFKYNLTTWPHKARMSFGFKYWFL